MNLLAIIAHRIDDALGRLCRAIVLVTMVALLAVIGANVGARYLMAKRRDQRGWAAAELLFPWLIAAGVILGVQHGSHIAVDFISRLGRRQPDRRGL